MRGNGSQKVKPIHTFLHQLTLSHTCLNHEKGLELRCEEIEILLMFMKKRYRKKYCREMFEFFNIPHTYEKVVPDRNGSEKILELPNILPTFERFAVNIGVCTEILLNWCKCHKEFAQVYKQCRALQKDMMNDLALRGFYNATYTAFAAKNLAEKETSSEQDIRDAYLKAMSELTNDKMGKE